MKHLRRALGVLAIALPLAVASCSEEQPSTEAPPDTGTSAGTDSGAAASATDDAEARAAAVQAMHDALLVDVVALAQAAEDIRTAAPLPTGRGWSATEDAAAIAAMRSAWIRARTAYEHVEGALAPLFPDIDTAIDARYDDFLVTLGAAGDLLPFDDQGITGMHAIERILFIDETPPRVVDFEKTLVGYSPARPPATAEEAAAFKDGLCAKLVNDTKTLLGEWAPANIDVEIAYSGLVSLVLEQREKVQKAATSEEESRYSQRTMRDLRDNLVGSKTVYAAFRPWLLSKPGGAELDAAVAAGFDVLEQTYATVEGDAIPAPPSTWSAEAPTPADLATPFGKLYAAVEKEVDANDATSLVGSLERARELLGLRKLE